MPKDNKVLLISVIVPAYNEERHIEECLQSIKNQTYPKIELIVIDDGSTDDTKKIAKKYADVLLLQSHQGLGASRNNGAMKAKGKILVFIDADMIADKNFVKDIVQPIVQGISDGAYTTEEFIANADNIWSKCFIIDNNLKNNSRISSEDLKNHKFFRAILKSVFMSSNGFDPQMGYEDDRSFHSAAKKIKVVKAKAILHHYNPDTLSDVFLSARWVGRSPSLKLTVKNILRYSIINSMKISLKKISQGASVFFVVYKVIFDFGILSGMFTKNKRLNFAK